MFGLPKIEIGDGFFRQVNVIDGRIAAIERRLDNFAPVFKQILRQVILPSIENNFIMQGRPEPWKRLSPSRISHRSGSSHPVLFWTGDLFKTATDESNYKVNRFSLELVSLQRKIPYAGFHQFGTIFMPQREFILYQQDDIERIIQWFETYIDMIVESEWGFSSGGDFNTDGWDFEGD